MLKLMKLLKELESDIINAFVGITLIVSLILIFKNPNNQYAILTACVAGGFMNILNGWKMIKDPKKKTTGMSYILLGVILIFLGFILTQIGKTQS